MGRYIEIRLDKREVSCLARLLEDEAPRSAEVLWNLLPVSEQVFHAKYARNEIYTFVPPPVPARIGPENPTVTPIPGDVCLIEFGSGQLPASTYGYDPGQVLAGGDDDPERVVDLALFYGRNNLLLNADVGFVPANVVGTVVEGLDAMADAANDIWRAGAIGEVLTFKKAEAR